MANFLTVANWLLPMLYLALLIDYGAAFFLRSPRAGRSLWLPLVPGLHVAFLALLGAHLGRPVPSNNFEVLSALAASMTAVYWFVEHASRERRTGVFVLLAAFLMQYTASVFLPAADLQPGVSAAAGGAAGLHIIPAIVAYTAITLSAIYGLLYLTAMRNLKHHRFGLLFDRLPPLDLLGTMNWHASLVGLAFMTLAIVSGALMYYLGRHQSMGGPGAKVLTKILAGGTAWAIYSTAAIGKWIGKWTAAKVCVITFVGFLVVLAMLVASIMLS